MRKPATILILSVSAGSGHMRAASALNEALMDNYPSCAVEVVDTFQYVSPFLQKMVLSFYLEMVRFTPRVYGYLYRKLEQGQSAGRSKARFNRLLNRLTADRLARLFAEREPAALVCTDPYALGVLDHLKRRGELSIPVVTAVTDFSVHPFWVFDVVDLYLVGDEALVSQLVRQGADAQKAVVTGIPIDPVFSRPVDRKEEKRRMGLRPDEPCALVMGGGLGMGPLEEVVRALSQAATPLQMLVVAGNNAALKERLEKLTLRPDRTCRVFGFVEEIHRFMEASDLMIGKAGGLSCAEALAVGLPIFVIDPIPGQEERNTEFLARRGAAVLVQGASGAVVAVENYLQSPEMRLSMRRCAQALARPEAAAAAARAIGSLVGWDCG